MDICRWWVMVLGCLWGLLGGVVCGGDLRPPRRLMRCYMSVSVVACLVYVGVVVVAWVVGGSPPPGYTERVSVEAAGSVGAFLALFLVAYFVYGCSSRRVHHAAERRVELRPSAI